MNLFLTTEPPDTVPQVRGLPEAVTVKRPFRPSNIVGDSKGMRLACELVEKVAPTTTPVLFLGESGVGKELFANAVHRRSQRADKPLVKVNCSALPPPLIESELFGHAKGAFPGATTAKKGGFEVANGGTIFLDEIGELSLPIQTRLLRGLQEKRFQPVGSSTAISADVRIIAATNTDLSAQVKGKAFREDLYYLLNVFPITISPLRERKTDIPLLINHFVEKYAQQMGRRISRVSTPAIDMLTSYHWPGNVRELKNYIERAVIMCDGPVLRGPHLPLTLQTVTDRTPPTAGSLQTQLDTIEYELIMEEIKRCNGNMSKAAKVLGLTSRVMRLRVKKYNIEIRNYKKAGKREL